MAIYYQVLLLMVVVKKYTGFALKGIVIKPQFYTEQAVQIALYVMQDDKHLLRNKPSIFILKKYIQMLLIDILKFSGMGWKLIFIFRR